MDWDVAKLNQVTLFRKRRIMMLRLLVPHNLIQYFFMIVEAVLFDVAG